MATHAEIQSELRQQGALPEPLDDVEDASRLAWSALTDDERAAAMRDYLDGAKARNEAFRAEWMAAAIAQGQDREQALDAYYAAMQLQRPEE